MLDLISKFISYVTDFFSSIFELPQTVLGFVSSSTGVLSFLGEDVATLIVGLVGTLLASLLIYLIVRLVVSLL